MISTRLSLWDSKNVEQAGIMCQAPKYQATDIHHSSTRQITDIQQSLQRQSVMLHGIQLAELNKAQFLPVYQKAAVLHP
jgi:hypothetical protein